LICAFITSLPPIGRRSDASSSTTHKIGASGRSSAAWRRWRSSIRRLTSAALCDRLAEVGLEPGRQHLAETVPPAQRVGLAHQVQDLLALLVLGHAVEGEQVLDVALLERDLPGLQAADLRLGGPDVVPGLAHRDVLLLAQASQQGTQEYAAHR
jgi:hypothetical protein